MCVRVMCSLISFVVRDNKKMIFWLTLDQNIYEDNKNAEPTKNANSESDYWFLSNQCLLLSAKTASISR